MKEIIIYHGSENIIETPEYGKGKPYKDYGRGFYCTEYIDLAKEWACDEKRTSSLDRAGTSTQG